VPAVGRDHVPVGLRRCVDDLENRRAIAIAADADDAHVADLSIRRNRSDIERMSTATRRYLFAVVALIIGLLVLVVDHIDKGWTTLGVIGVACLVVAIAAELVVLRRSS
jgi:membrane-bound ClpP family serine protease